MTTNATNVTKDVLVGTGIGSAEQFEEDEGIQQWESMKNISRETKMKATIAGIHDQEKNEEDCARKYIPA